MDTDTLRIFIEVYQLNSFSKVAQQHNVAPSSISRTIASLEQNLGVRLFQRTTRKIYPTEAGQQFYARILPLSEELQAACEELTLGSEQASGTLTIAASTSFGQLVLCDLLTQFRQQYPNIRLHLELHDRHSDIVAEGIDVAIRHGQLNDSSLVAVKLTQVKYLLVASSEYLQNHSPISHPNELQHHALIGFSYDNFRTQWVFQQQTERVECPVSPVITSTNADALRRCALNGQGLTLLADWTIHEDLETGLLHRVLPDWQAFGAQMDNAIWLVYPSRKFLPAKTKVFIEFMQQALKKGGRPATTLTTIT